ncbi:hypothetical protein D3C72_1638960 [compost metagenome]
MHHAGDRGAAFEPAGRIVVRRHFVEAQLLVVVGPDPLGGVDGALFQRGIDIARRNLLRHRAQLGQNHAADSADPHVQAFQVGDRLDLLAVPAAHLHADVATDVVHDVVFLIERPQHLQAAAGMHPGVVLARAQAERQAGIESQRRVLADVGRAQHVVAFHRPVADRVHVLRGRHQFAAGERADLELAVGQLRHALA